MKMLNSTNKKRKFCFSKKKGFSLMELMIAIFIFTLIMVASSAFFSRAILAYKNVRSAQRDLEDAQFVLGLMAKTLRTGSIKSPIVATANTDTIVVFDYSQNKCIKYYFNTASHKIQSGSADVPSAGCHSLTVMTTPLSNLSNFYVNNAYFSITPSCDPTNSLRDPLCSTPSNNKVLGKLTISLEICPSIACSDKARIQTSVSLRDYGVAGL